MNQSHSDSDLFKRVRSGDQTALDFLSIRHRPYLRKVIESRLDDRLAARVDPSDLIQETLIEALRRIENGVAECPLPLRLWLRQIAMDRVQMAHRRHLYSQKRGLFREVVLPDRSSIILARQLQGKRSVENQPQETMLHSEMTHAIRKALAELSDIDREILTMRTFEALSYGEIELVTGIAAQTCRKRYGRALVRLSKLLDAFADSSADTKSHEA